MSESNDTGGAQTATRTTCDAVSGPRSGGTGGRFSSTLLRHGLLMLLALVGMALLIETVSPFRVSQLAQMAYYLPAVAGLTVLTGINGQISLGHGALMACGAYTTAVLLDRNEGIPFVLVLVMSIVVTALVGVVVGAAASRLHGPYLAGATLALAVGLPGVANYFEDLFGGEQGLGVSPPRASGATQDAFFFLTGNDLSNSKYMAYLGWVLALLVLLVLSNLVRSRYGRVWRAVRDDEVAAELAGINLGRARVLAFVVSAACAGLAGSLMAVVTRLAAPTSFTIVLSIFLLVAIVVGGLGSLFGAVIGSALLVFFIPFATDRGRELGLSGTQAAEVAPLSFGVFLVLVMLLAPQGLVGTIRLKYLTRKASRSAARSRGADTEAAIARQVAQLAKDLLPQRLLWATGATLVLNPTGEPQFEPGGVVGRTTTHLHYFREPERGPLHLSLPLAEDQGAEELTVIYADAAVPMLLLPGSPLNWGLASEDEERFQFLRSHLATAAVDHPGGATN